MDTNKRLIKLDQDLDTIIADLDELLIASPVDHWVFLLLDHKGFQKIIYSREMNPDRQFDLVFKPNRFQSIKPTSKPLREAAFEDLLERTTFVLDRIDHKRRVAIYLEAAS